MAALRGGGQRRRNHYLEILRRFDGEYSIGDRVTVGIGQVDGPRHRAVWHGRVNFGRTEGGNGCRASRAAIAGESRGRVAGACLQRRAGERDACARRAALRVEVGDDTGLGTGVALVAVMVMIRKDCRLLRNWTSSLLLAASVTDWVVRDGACKLRSVGPNRRAPLSRMVPSSTRPDPSAAPFCTCTVKGATALFGSENSSVNRLYKPARSNWRGPKTVIVSPLCCATGADLLIGCLFLRGLPRPDAYVTGAITDWHTIASISSRAMRAGR